MLDNVSLSVDLGSPIIRPVDSRERIIFGNLELAGILNIKDFSSYTYKGKERDLMFTLSDQTLRINNSLHKFFAGENYSDFTFKHLEYAINEIESLTQIQSNNIKIHTCELALNIETELPGKDYLRMFGLCNFQKASNMMSGKTLYGIKYVFTEYSIKIYDKTEHYKLVYSKQLTKNILRFEIEYKKSRRLYGLNSLSDILDKMKIESAFNDYFNILKKLKCVQSNNGGLLDRNEMALYYAGKNQDYWNSERLRGKESFKYLKKLYAVAVNKANETDLMPTFLKLLEDKYETLLNS
jgi:hypothetical protein